MNGDYSAENQEKVANEYVASRYGSWTALKLIGKQITGINIITIYRKFYLPIFYCILCNFNLKLSIRYTIIRWLKVFHSFLVGTPTITTDKLAALLAKRLR